MAVLTFPKQLNNEPKAGGRRGAVPFVPGKVFGVVWVHRAGEGAVPTSRPAAGCSGSLDLPFINPKRAPKQF